MRPALALAMLITSSRLAFAAAAVTGDQQRSSTGGLQLNAVEHQLFCGGRPVMNIVQFQHSNRMPSMGAAMGLQHGRSRSFGGDDVNDAVGHAGSFSRD